MTVDMFRLANPKIQYAGTLTNYLPEGVTYCFHLLWNLPPQRLSYIPCIILATDSVLNNILTQREAEVNRTDMKKQRSTNTKDYIYIYNLTFELRNMKLCVCVCVCTHIHKQFNVIRKSSPPDSTTIVIKSKYFFWWPSCNFSCS